MRVQMACKAAAVFDPLFIKQKIYLSLCFPKYILFYGTPLLQPSTESVNDG